MKDFHLHDGIALPIRSLGLLPRLIFKHPFYDFSLQGIQTPFDSLQTIMLYTGRTHTTKSTRHFLFRQSTILKYLKFTFTARNFKRSGFGFPKDSLKGFSEFSISSLLYEKGTLYSAPNLLSFVYRFPLLKNRIIKEISMKSLFYCQRTS